MKAVKFLPFLFIPLLLISFCLGSCEKYVTDFDFEKKEARLVINALLNPDSIVTVHISTSKTLNPPSPSYYLTEAEVMVYENGKLLGTMLHDSMGYYLLPDVRPQAGATYRIEASAEDYATAYGETRIPQGFRIEQIESEFLPSYPLYDGWEHRTQDLEEYRIVLKLPEGVDTWHGVSLISEGSYSSEEWECVTLDEPYYNGYMWTQDSCYLSGNIVTQRYRGATSSIAPQDFIQFRSGWSYFEMGERGLDNFYQKHYFSRPDKHNPSLSLLLRINANPPSEGSDQQLTLYIDSYSEALYKQMYSLAQAEEVGDNPFAEKINIYTNVVNGLGLVGSINNTNRLLPPPY